MNKSAFAVIMASLLFSCGLLAEDTVGNYTGDEVVVTATKTENKRKEVSSSVIIIDEASIKASSAQSVGDLLANHAGIELRTYGNYGGAAQEIQIRGMSADGTQVFVNGVNVNSLSLGTADVAKIPLANIERIEVVKGAGSLLYGSGAAGGVINIFTKRPDKSRTDLLVSADYGTQATQGFSVKNGMALSENLGYCLTLGQHQTDGFRDNSDSITRDGSLNLTYDKGQDFKVTLYGDYSRRKFGMPGVKPPEGTADYYVSGQKYYNSSAESLLNRHEDDDAHGVVRVDGKAAENIQYSLKGDYSSSKSYNYDRTISGNKTWVTNRTKGVEANTVIKPVSGAELLLGGEYRSYEHQNRQVFLDALGAEIAPVAIDLARDLHSDALFSELQYRPDTWIKLQSGIRQEENSMFGVKNIYRYGLVLNPAGKTSIKFNRGSHFKAPTMNDLFWPDDGFAKGNPLLQPETGWHTDLSLDQGLGEKIFVTAGYFNWDVANKIAWAEDPSQQALYGYNYWVPTNLDSYHASGMELGANFGPFDNVSFSLDYTLLHAVEEKAGTPSRQSSYTPEHQLRCDVTYKYNGEWSLSPSLMYTDRRPYYAGQNRTAVPTEFLPSYWILDLKIEKRFNDHFSASLSGRNLFDESYATNMSSFFDRKSYVSTLSPYPGAGRSFLLSVTYKY